MNLKPLFEPKTIAVIGVSLTNNLHPANVIYSKNYLRYPVTVFPVNPRGGTLQGERVFANISEIPERVDLAVIAARADYVPGILSDCIQAGAGGAVVVSGGFAESGRQDLQCSGKIPGPGVVRVCDTSSRTPQPAVWKGP